MSLLDLLPFPFQRPLKRHILSLASNCSIVHHGTHFIFDVKTRLPKESVNIIFDVGANRGQSIDEYRMEFPEAQIVPFEPDPRTFKALQGSHPPSDRLRLVNSGLSERLGKLRFDDRAPATEIHRIADDQSDTSLEQLDFTTLDAFCKEFQFDRIDLLKVDTEGHDLNVLRGAADMLARSRINILICECLMTARPTRPVLVPFSQIHDAMGELGYVFFGLYYQEAPHNGSRAQIAYANCAYISPAVAARN